MGSGIAQIAAEAGFDVTIVDTDRKFIDRGIGTIGKFLERKAAKGTISKEHDGPEPFETERDDGHESRS